MFAKKIAKTLEKPLDMKNILNVAPYDSDPKVLVDPQM